MGSDFVGTISNGNLRLYLSIGHELATVPLVSHKASDQHVLLVSIYFKPHEPLCGSQLGVLTTLASQIQINYNIKFRIEANSV